MDWNYFLKRPIDWIGENWADGICDWGTTILQWGFLVLVAYVVGAFIGLGLGVFYLLFG